MFNLNEEGYACWAGHAAVGGIAATAASWGARRKRPRARGVAFCSRALGASRYAAERRSRSADRFPPVEKFRTTRRILRIAAGQTRQLTCRAIYLAIEPRESSRDETSDRGDRGDPPLRRTRMPGAKC